MDYSESYRTELKKGIEDKQHMYWKYLFRSEILLDYFKRETDKGKASGLQSLHRFKGKGNNEQVILTNSLSNLYDKELITIYDGECTRWQGILLTAKGIDIAKLLKVKI
jgi:hypothetical protein